jgi:integrase
MFSIMKFGQHLIRDNDGTWWLAFEQGEFKNRRALKSDYKVRVARELWPLLDRYKEEFHPVLASSNNSAFVFLSAKRGRRRKPRGCPISEKNLSKIVRYMTEIYIPGAKGFMAHAFRHLVATDIIKRDPKVGFFLASIALHDKLETVEETYVHLKTSEFFEPVNTHFSEAWRMVFGHGETIQIQTS